MLAMDLPVERGNMNPQSGDGLSEEKIRQKKKLHCRCIVSHPWLSRHMLSREFDGFHHVFGFEVPY
jgi:hypothetical protein